MMRLTRCCFLRIGKGGSKIKEIQEASGARLNASEQMLPGSTEVSRLKLSIVASHCTERGIDTFLSVFCQFLVSPMPYTSPCITSERSFSNTKSELEATRAPRGLTDRLVGPLPVLASALPDNPP